MRHETTDHDFTPYIVPAYLLHGIARYILDIDKIMEKFGIDVGPRSVEIMGTFQQIINETNADQPPINLTTLPTIDL